MGNIRDTQYFQTVQDKKMEAADVLEQVYIALPAIPPISRATEGPEA